MGSIQFVENYIQRYGEPHPIFYQGSLEDALREACHKPAKDVSYTISVFFKFIFKYMLIFFNVQRKLLAIYLHHDESVLTNVFCDQLMRCESVMQTLIQSFILFGWDLTHESNKNLYITNCIYSVVLYFLN